MSWRTSSRFDVASIGFAVSVVVFAARQKLEAQPMAPAVITVAARTGNIPTLTLQQPAMLHVGGVLDNPDDELDHKNFFIAGAMLSTGGLAVADGFRLRIYDKSGKQTAVLGKAAGAGPNEFNSLWRICTTRGDTLIAHDSRNARVSVFTAAGQLVRQFPARGVTFVRMRCLNDGTFLVHRAEADSAALSMVAYLRRRTDGTDESIVGVFPFSTKVLAPTPYVATASGQELVIADPATRDIVVRDIDGAVIRSYRLQEQTRTVSAKVAENSTIYAAQGIKVESPGPVAPPSSNVPWPLYRRLEIDTDRNMWLQDMTLKATDPQSWTRVNLKGAVTGRLALPPLIVVATKEMADVVAFTNRGVLLLIRDSDGAVHFRYHIIQPAPR